MHLILLIFLLTLFSFFVDIKGQISWSQPLVKPENLQKINFDLTAISPDGLIGDQGSLRSVSYEFCIPNNPTLVEQIQQIDPTIQLYPGSLGRILCQKDEILCLGDTHNPQWQEILVTLTELPYVQQIHQSFFE